ncbi:MAG TPA: hypothetical protein VIV60_26475 [Polyangiaceae bacterium]
MKPTAMILVLATLIAGVPGCKESDKIENKITCGDVCNRYKDCFNKDYDVDKCKSSCEADANADEDKDRRLEECNDCIDGQSCTGAAFGCATDCAGILVI